MSELFDTYDKTFAAVVQSSINFSGLSHSFFTDAKADALRGLISTRLQSGCKPRMLDVGCGVGEIHPVVRPMAGRLCGVDVSAASVTQARRRNPDVDYKIYDGESLPYDAGSFDLAIAICVLHHVPPQRWPTFLREMRRVVRPGGLICLIEHNPFNPLTRLAVARCEFDEDAVLLRGGRARGLLVDVGLQDTDLHYFLMLPSAAPLARRVEHRFRRLPLGAQYVVSGIA
jgi:SAM-dependent methyltransferase